MKIRKLDGLIVLQVRPEQLTTNESSEPFATEPFSSGLIVQTCDVEVYWWHHGRDVHHKPQRLASWGCFEQNPPQIKPASANAFFNHSVHVSSMSWCWFQLECLRSGVKSSLGSIQTVCRKLLNLRLSQPTEYGPICKTCVSLRKVVVSICLKPLFCLNLKLRCKVVMIVPISPPV